MPAQTPPLWITVVVLATLAVTFAASWWMFFALAHRWIEGRPGYALSDWARERGFHFARSSAPEIDQDKDRGHRPRLRAAPPALPPALETLHAHDARPLTVLSNPRQQLVEFLWHAPPPPPEAHTDAGPRPGASGWTPGHVLLQTIADSWPATALRPAEHAVSLLDALVSSNAAVGGSNERFAVLGDDAAAARLLVSSSVRALLPADVGFLLVGQTMLLDFSARPFDPIELDRMLSVAKQVAEHVPRRG